MRERPALHGPSLEICGNGLDDNGDGLVDCRGPAVLRRPGLRLEGGDLRQRPRRRRQRAGRLRGPVLRRPARVSGTSWRTAATSKDDDGDGKLDCQDPDCFKHPACKKPGQEVCNNGLDDDEDGKIDCQDERLRLPAHLQAGQGGLRQQEGRRQGRRHRLRRPGLPELPGLPVDALQSDRGLRRDPAPGLELDAQRLDGGHRGRLCLGLRGARRRRGGHQVHPGRRDRPQARLRAALGRPQLRAATGPASTRRATPTREAASTRSRPRAGRFSIKALAARRLLPGRRGLRQGAGGAGHGHAQHRHPGPARGLRQRHRRRRRRRPGLRRPGLRARAGLSEPALQGRREPGRAGGQRAGQAGHGRHHHRARRLRRDLRGGRRAASASSASSCRRRPGWR